MEPQTFSPEQTANLLVQQTVSDQTAWLNAHGESALTTLLETARGQLRVDPAVAHKLATIGVACAEGVDEAAALIPPAQYVQAESLAIRGEFGASAALIEQARLGYDALDDRVGAWNSVPGLMMVLGKQGDFAGALRVGNETVQAIEESGVQENELIAKLHKNRAICQLRLGKLDEAEQAIDLAAAVDGVTPFEQDQIVRQKGVILAEMGRMGEAISVWERPLDSFPPLYQAQALQHLGQAYLRVGRYTDCLNMLDEAQTLWADHSELERSVGLIDAADAYLALNMYQDALERYKEAQKGVQDVPHQTAKTWLGIGAVHSARTAWTSATIAYLNAFALYVQIGSEPMLAFVETELAGVALAQDEISRADEYVVNVLERLNGKRAPVQRVYCLLRAADVALAQDDVTAAVNHLDAAEQLDLHTVLPHIGHGLALRRGRVSVRQENVREAENYFQESIAIIESLRGTLREEALRTTFLQDKMAPYTALLSLYLDIGDEDSLQKAVTIGEQAKARTLVEMMQGVVTTRMEQKSGDDAELSNLLSDLNNLYNQLLGEHGDEQRSAAPYQQQAAALERKIERLRGRPPFNPPQREGVGDGTMQQQIFSFSHLSERLQSDMPLIAYHIIDGEVLAFIYADGALQVVRNLSQTVDLLSTLEEIADQWEWLRAGRAFATRHLARLERTAQYQLRQLYDVLFAPIFERIDVPKQMVIVPHGMLHHVPFHALFDGEQYMVERCAVSYAPSLAVWALCAERPSSPLTNAILLGVSDGIVGVAAEIDAISAQLPTTMCHLDDEATTDVLHDGMTDADILHIATHGLFRDDNPLFSAVKLHDKWLTVHDIMQLPTTPPLVTLSACDSGRQRVIAGDETLGIVRAFLSRGTSTLITSQWLIQDEIAAAFMPLLYRNMRGAADYAHALRQTQLTIKQSHPHPYYWASCQLIGRR